MSSPPSWVSRCTRTTSAVTFVRLVRRANDLRLGEGGRAVSDVQQVLGLTTSGSHGRDTRDAVRAYQQTNGLPVTGVVDPRTWYQLFPNQPLRSYPHPGHLPPIRLHDLRHGAATLAHAAGTDMKVISEMLSHSTYKFTADTYTNPRELHLAGGKPRVARSRWGRNSPTDLREAAA